MKQCKYAYRAPGKEFLRCKQMKGMKDDMCIYQYWCHQIQNYRNTNQITHCDLALVAHEHEKVDLREDK